MAGPIAVSSAAAVTLSCGIRGLHVTRPLEGMPAFEFTTGVFVETETAASLRRFFSEKIVDATAALCLDAPGMGKTTTVERAADGGGAVYMRFSARGIMRNALGRTLKMLEMAAAKGGGVVDGTTAEGIGLAVWRLALVACMDNCRIGLKGKRRMMGLCDGNCVKYDLLDGDVGGAFASSRDALLAAVTAGASSGDWSTEAVIALHFDEVQLMLPDPLEHGSVRDRRPSAPASPAECMRYCLVWFSSALLEMCAGGRFRPCLTGISVDAVDSLRLDSSIKLWSLDPLPYFSARFVKQVLAAFVRFDMEDDLEAVVRGVSGCPRAVQHALRIVRWRADAIARGEEVPPISCTDLVSRAYDSWRAQGVSGIQQGNIGNLRAAEEAFVCVCYPAAWGATAATAEDGVPVAEMHSADVKQSWRVAAHVGVLRLRMTSDVATLFPPYPFLERYLRKLGPQRLLMSDCIELVQRVRMFPSASGAMGRGKAFEFAVALELCLPGNVLLRAILSSDELRPLSLQPLVADVMMLRRFQSVDLGAVCAVVCVVSDSSAISKPGDIAIPVEIPSASAAAPRKPAWLILEVKSSTASDSAYVREGQVSFVEKMQSEPMQHFNLSCYLPTLNTRTQTSKPVKADVALSGFNRSATSDGQLQRRYMGLVVLDDNLLSACTLDLLSILHCEEHVERTEAEWFKLIFSDKPTRALIATELHTRASDLERSEFRVPVADGTYSAGLAGAGGYGRDSSGSVYVRGAASSSAAHGEDVDALLREATARISELELLLRQDLQREREHADALTARISELELQLSRK